MNSPKILANRNSCHVLGILLNLSNFAGSEVASSRNHSLSTPVCPARPQPAMASSSQKQGSSKYVTLISSDGFEFVVLREAACISKAIKKMLAGELSSLPYAAIAQQLMLLETGSFLESARGDRCNFEEIKYVLPTFLRCFVRDSFSKSPIAIDKQVLEQLVLDGRLVDD